MSIILHEYCKFYKATFESPIQYYCDNKEVVKKLHNIIEKNRAFYSSNLKMEDLDAVLEIQRYIPITTTVSHVKGH